MTMATTATNLLLQFEQIGMLANEVFSDIMSVINNQQSKMKTIKSRITKLESATDNVVNAVASTSSHPNPSIYYDHPHSQDSSTQYTGYRYTRIESINRGKIHHNFFGEDTRNHYMERCRTNKQIETEMNTTLDFPGLNYTIYPRSRTRSLKREWNKQHQIRSNSTPYSIDTENKSEHTNKPNTDHRFQYRNPQRYKTEAQLQESSAYDGFHGEYVLCYDPSTQKHIKFKVPKGRQLSRSKSKPLTQSTTESASAPAPTPPPPPLLPMSYPQMSQNYGPPPNPVPLRPPRNPTMSVYSPPPNPIAIQLALRNGPPPVPPPNPVSMYSPSRLTLLQQLMSRSGPPPVPRVPPPNPILSRPSRRQIQERLDRRDELLRALRDKGWRFGHQPRNPLSRPPPVPGAGRQELMRMIRGDKPGAILPPPVPSIPMLPGELRYGWEKNYHNWTPDNRDRGHDWHVQDCWHGGMSRCGYRRCVIKRLINYKEYAIYKIKDRRIYEKQYLKKQKLRGNRLSFEEQLMKIDLLIYGYCICSKGKDNDDEKGMFNLSIPWDVIPLIVMYYGDEYKGDEWYIELAVNWERLSKNEWFTQSMENVAKYGAFNRKARNTWMYPAGTFAIP